LLTKYLSHSGMNKENVFCFIITVFIILCYVLLLAYK
jgi:hypothetical protein